MNNLLEVAIVAATTAGKEIMQLYTETDFETKTDGSPVTLADTRSNTILIEHLLETGIPILSEESEGISTPYPERLWIIDPLDGTKDFLKKNGDFCVMIGLLEEGRPVLGVVYAPAYDVLYYAEKGVGAFKVQNGITTKLVQSPSTHNHLRFVCSVNHFTPHMEAVTTILSAEKTPRGSIGIKSSVVAENNGEFFFSSGNLGEWDVCAPEIILCEAGGIVTDCEGNPLLYGNSDHRVQNGILFSKPQCHEEVLRAIESVGT